MSIHRSLFLLMLACLVGAVCGCASTPPKGNPSQDSVRSGTDDYDGWLYNSVAGRRKAKAEQGAPAGTQPVDATGVSQSANPSGVQQASAWAAPADDTGPLVAGPSTAAGPPPTIPAELPPPPAGAISISAVKLREEEEKKKEGFDISDLAPENVYKNIKKATGYGPDEKIAKTAMDEGKTLFKQATDKMSAAHRRGLDEKSAAATKEEAVALFKQAGEKFAKAADRWPDSPLEEDAFFLQSESEFFADQYPKAHDTVGGLLKKYPNTRHLDTAIAREFAMGRYWEQMYAANPTWPTTPNLTEKSKPMFDTFGYAVQAYERVRTYDPKGPLADASLMALGNAYFLRGQWGDAAYNYDLLIKEYPESKYQLKAHLFALQVNMRRYQGSAYDDGPLKESGRLAKVTLTQYNSKLGDERQRVFRSQVQIENEKANRDFIRGQYYAGRHCYGAARLYYNSVIDEFPGTETANKAKAELEKIRNEPDEPSGFFQSLFGRKHK
jgi:outer membrane protein assembly factor BamD (BamD/ComL family)